MGARFVYQSSWGTNLPASTTAQNSTLIVGNIFSFAVDGYIVGMRYCRAANDDEEHVGAVLLEADNTHLGVTRFKFNSGATPTGWQHAYLRPRVAVTAGVLYFVAVSFGERQWRYTNGALTSTGITTGDVVVPQDSSPHWNGAFSSSFQRSSWTHAAGTRYGVDVLFLRGDLT